MGKGCHNAHAQREVKWLGKEGERSGAEATASVQKNENSSDYTDAQSTHRRDTMV